MFISEKLVNQYQKIYEQKFGEKITAKKAEQELSNLAELIKTANKARRKKW